MPATIPFTSASAPVPTDPIGVTVCLVTIYMETSSIRNVEVFDVADRAHALDKASALNEDGDGEYDVRCIFVTGVHAAALQALSSQRETEQSTAMRRQLADAMCAMFSALTSEIDDAAFNGPDQDEPEDDDPDESLAPGYGATATTAPTWTPKQLRVLRAFVNEMLDLQVKAVERAMVVLHARQTADEQNSDATLHHNMRGFSANHAKRGSYYARWVKSGRNLDGKHVALARGIAKRHSAQLVEEMLNGKDGAAKAAKILAARNA